MDVDEAGRDDSSRDVNGACRGIRDCRRNSGDRVAIDSDVAAIPGTPRAVDDTGVAKQEVVARRLGGSPFERERPDDEYRRADEAVGDGRSCAQNRDPVSVTSDFAQAFFNRASIAEASSLRP